MSCYLFSARRRSSLDPWLIYLASLLDLAPVSSYWLPAWSLTAHCFDHGAQCLKGVPGSVFGPVAPPALIFCSRLDQHHVGRARLQLVVRAAMRFGAFVDTGSVVCLRHLSQTCGS